MDTTQRGSRRLTSVLKNRTKNRNQMNDSDKNRAAGGLLVMLSVLVLEIYYRFPSHPCLEVPLGTTVTGAC